MPAAPPSPSTFFISLIFGYYFFSSSTTFISHIITRCSLTFVVVDLLLRSFLPNGSCSHVHNSVYYEPFRTFPSLYVHMETLLLASFLVRKPCSALANYTLPRAFYDDPPLASHNIYVFAIQNRAPYLSGNCRDFGVLTY